MKKTKDYLLLCPGPVNVHENICQAMTTHIGHREEEFSDLLSRVNEKLLDVYEIKNRNTYYPVVITGSGTAANEAVLTSIVGDKHILVITNGEFGERLYKISKHHNKHTHVLSFNWGENINIDLVEKALQKQNIDIIAMVHHETSTGMLNDINQVGKLAKKYNTQLFVDTVSSATAEKIDLEKWNVTFCSTSSGKAVSSLPGLGVIFGKKKAFEALKDTHSKTVYLNLYNLYHYSKSLKQTPNTPSVHLIYALDQALTNILEMGIEVWRQSILERALILRTGMKRLGLEFLLNEDVMSSVLTTVIVPGHISVDVLKKKLKEKYIVIYSGKGPLLGMVFQVGNIGNITKKDLHFFLQTLEGIIHGDSRQSLSTQKSLSPAPNFFSYMIHNFQRHKVGN